jgi:thioesterase domain-containing protein
MPAAPGPHVIAHRAMAASRPAAIQLVDADDEVTPLDCADALCRTAAEASRQHERLGRLGSLSVSRSELAAATAMVDTIDLALAECVRDFERRCDATPVCDDPDLRQKANALWLAAREYLRRHSIAEKASRRLTQHDADVLGDLHFEFELEASALLALRQACSAYGKLRPDARL